MTWKSEQMADKLARFRNLNWSRMLAGVNSAHNQENDNSLLSKYGRRLIAVGQIVEVLAPLGTKKTPPPDKGEMTDHIARLRAAIAICAPEVEQTGTTAWDWMVTTTSVGLSAGVGAVIGALVAPVDIVGDDIPWNVASFWGSVRASVGLSASVGASLGLLWGVGNQVAIEVMDSKLDEPAVIACTAVVAFMSACAANEYPVDPTLTEKLRDIVRTFTFPDSSEYIKVLEWLTSVSTSGEVVTVHLLSAVKETNILRNPEIQALWWPSFRLPQLPVTISEEGVDIVLRPYQPLFPLIT